MVKDDDDDDDDELGFSDMPSQVDEEDQEMAQDSKNQIRSNGTKEQCTESFNPLN